MFRGFQGIEYPEYEVLTPQSHDSFTIRTLTVMKEERLRGSLVTPIQITDHLNKIIWECLVKKPEHIATYDDFLKNVTLKDRDALLYGLYHVSYEDIRNYMVSCVSCQKEFPITVKASSTFSFNAYPNDADKIIGKRTTVPLPKTPGVSAILKQPTLADEVFSLKNLSAKVELISVTLPIEKFVQEKPEGGENVVYEERGDVLDAYLSLPPLDKREIYKQYYETFGKYAIELKCKAYCPSCGHDDIIDIDLVEQFFRMVLSI